MKTNYFQGNSAHPQHISVGAILINDKGEVCCNHIFTRGFNGYWAKEGLDDFYLLMRKTLEPGETLEIVLKRGLKEEFGAEGEADDYVGSIQSHFKHEGTDVEKTTLYFLCRLINQDLSNAVGESTDSKSETEWRKPEFLIPIMKQQAVKYGRTDVDESAILERLEILSQK